MISSVYSYYLSRYATKPATRFDSHKKSDLRSVYNKMVNINKKSPLYKIDLSDDMQKLAIDIKEGAMELKNISMVLDEVGDDRKEKKFKAESDNSEAVTAKLVGTGENGAKDYEVDIKQAAVNQINTGHYLPPKSKYLEEGLYSFDVETAGVTYELQFSVDKQDTANDIQQKIARIINRSGVGMDAEVLTDALGNTALSVVSKDTGIQNMKPLIFNITDESSVNKSGAVEYLGLDRVVQYPGNAIFTVDGEEKSSSKNIYQIDKNVEIEIKDKTDGPIRVSVTEDTEVVANEITRFMSSYNKILDFAKDSSEKFKGNNRLLNEFERMSRMYNSTLAEYGFKVSDSGDIEIDSENDLKTMDREKLADVLNGFSDFRSQVVKKAENMASNPMEYLNKKIVAYKNPNRSFANPYNASMYAGIMFDGYY